MGRTTSIFAPHNLTDTDKELLAGSNSLCDMLPYLAAAGHNNYTNTLALFIPKMLELAHTHPDVHSDFMQGYFPVRRCDGPVYSRIYALSKF